MTWTSMFSPSKNLAKEKSRSAESVQTLSFKWLFSWRISGWVFHWSKTGVYTCTSLTTGVILHCNNGGLAVVWAPDHPHWMGEQKVITKVKQWRVFLFNRLCLSWIFFFLWVLSGTGDFLFDIWGLHDPSVQGGQDWDCSLLHQRERGLHSSAGRRGGENLKKPPDLFYET